MEQYLAPTSGSFCGMTLSFSKLAIMHEASLLLFLHRYNRERAILLK